MKYIRVDLKDERGNKEKILFVKSEGVCESIHFTLRQDLGISENLDCYVKEVLWNAPFFLDRLNPEKKIVAIDGESPHHYEGFLDIEEIENFLNAEV